ncbi:hypothetical protein RF11_13225 [Thelohanellus kitauei]|uniref:Uncharacterized protein n=1 Tax=Thelohanellus kitauei TaxID=669202 RepID=A0A0C2MKT7_THEKT|nr:hypothetical protein RF11_13225 [Thelohanellus kitauei]
MSILNNNKNFEESDYQDWIYKFEKALVTMGKFNDLERISTLHYFLDWIYFKFFLILSLEIRGSYPKSKEQLKTWFSPRIQSLTTRKTPFYVIKKSEPRYAALLKSNPSTSSVTVGYTRENEIEEETKEIITATVENTEDVTDIILFRNETVKPLQATVYLQKLIEDYLVIFKTNPGTTDRIFDRIETKPDTVTCDPSMKVTIHYRARIEEPIKNLLKNQIISPSSSSYCAPGVFVPKSNGEIRIKSVDYRSLNNITTKNTYAIPYTSDIQKTLISACYFSKIYLRSGDWQILVEL